MKEPIEVQVLRCGSKYQKASEEIKDQVDRIICWEAFKFRYEYQGYSINKTRKRKRRKRK